MFHGVMELWSEIRSPCLIYARGVRESMVSTSPTWRHGWIVIVTADWNNTTVRVYMLAWEHCSAARVQEAPLGALSSRTARCLWLLPS